MKILTEIDGASPSLRVEFTARSIEEIGAATGAIKAAARVLFPEIAFAGEPGFEDDEAPEEQPAPAPRVAPPAPAVVPKERKPINYKPPTEGSLGARILDAIHELGTSDVTAIADHLDILTPHAGAGIARLRKLGLIK